MRVYIVKKELADARAGAQAETVRANTAEALARAETRRADREERHETEANRRADEANRRADEAHGNLVELARAYGRHVEKTQAITIRGINLAEDMLKMRSSS